MTAATSSVATPSLGRFRRWWRRTSIPPVYGFVVIIFLLSILLDLLFGVDDQLFITNPVIMTNILVRSVALGIVAMGQTFVIIGASIDLSVAFMISVTAVGGSYLMAGEPGNVWWTVLVLLGVGVLVGLINGLLITRLRINPLIATLGIGLVLKGLLNAVFDNFAGSVPRSFQAFAYDNLGPIPISVLVLFAVIVVSWFILRQTKYGAHLYSVGGNQVVARLSGIRTSRTLTLAHIFCSVTAVLTGLFIVSRLRSGAPWVGTDGLYDLESIAAVVVGGTALSGGKGGVWGTLGGVLIFSLLDTMFNQIGIDAYLKQILRGGIIVLAVGFYTFRSTAEPS